MTMKKIHLKKPDIKGTFSKLRHLKKEDIKEWHRKKKERRERILEERPFCPEDAANLCFYEQNFIVASCLLGVCDQFHHRGHFKAFCL